MSNASISIDFISNVASLRTASEQSAKILSDFQSQANGVKNALSGAFGALSALIGVGAIGAMAKQAIDSADKLSLMSQSAGVAVDDLSRLSWAAEQSDISQESLAGGLGKLSKIMVAAASGSKDAGDAFAKIGVSAVDSAGSIRPTIDVMADVATRFAAMPDGAVKTAEAMKLFGKSGADLIPMLNGGGDGLREMANQAEALGLVIDSKTAKSANNFNDSLGVLSAVVKGVFNRVLVATAPILESFAVWLADNATGASAFSGAATVLGGALRGLGAVASIVFGAFQALGSAIGGVAAVAVRIISGDFKGALEVAKIASADVTDSLANSAKRTAEIWSGSVAKIDSETRQKFGALSAFVKASTPSDDVGNDGKARSGTVKSQKIDTSAMREANAMAQEAAALRKSILTEQQKIEADFSASQENASKLYAAGLITGTELVAARQKAVEDLESAYIALEAASSKKADSEIPRITLPTMDVSVDPEKSSIGKTYQQYLGMTETVTEQISNMWGNTAQRIASGIGDAFAQSIMAGKDMADTMRSMLRGVVQQVISGLVEIGVKWVMLQALKKAGFDQDSVMRATATTQTVAQNAAVATSAAPAAAATATWSFGAAAAMGLTALAAIYAASRLMAGQAHDGMTNIPRTGSYVLEGGERVIKRDQNRDLTEFMRRGAGGGGVNVTYAPVITAMDARGVNEVLQRHMGTIVSGVQQAYNNGGRRGGPIR